MSERTVVITGASDGIGAAAARSLAEAGDRVLIVGRSEAKTRNVAAQLGVESFVADFSRLDEVRRLAAQVLERTDRIDVLANNAGGLFSKGDLTVDGLDLTMQVNHFAPFLLTNLLLDRLKTSSATVINTSSAAARQGRIRLEQPHLVQPGGGFGAYGTSKLANVLFTFGLHRRFGADGISAAAFHPGVIATSFGTREPGPARFLYDSALSRLLRTPAQGAETLVWLATTKPGQDWQPGGYFERCRPARTNPQAYREDLIATFWDRSAAIVGLAS